MEVPTLEPYWAQEYTELSQEGQETEPIGT
jgi:hypothetical protein